MKKRLVSILMLLMLLTSTIPLILEAKSVEADITGHNRIVDDTVNQVHSTLDTMTHSAVADRKSDSRQEKTLENSGQTSPNDRNNWNFNDTSEWSSFAYVDGDKTRLIVGVNGMNPFSFLEFDRIAIKHQAEIVNTISIKGKVKAIVVELLMAFVAAFVKEIHVAGLASYIEPNMKVQAQFIPNDPYWSTQWGPQKIEADWAWNITVGDPSVLVAVVDTGIDYTHPDLATNYAPLGYDWVNLDADPLDDFGHGTHCAGIIAAVLNNGVGIAGLSQVRVLAEKVLDYSGWGYWDWVANGIIHATDCGADIISMSLGGYGDSELLHEAVKYAYDSGVLVIAAAGNDNTNMKSYPAAYSEVIAVAATDQYDNKAVFSNWGDWIELAAPGVDIYSTMPTYHVTLNDLGYAMNYDYLSGTSMACPHVSGVVALAWSAFSGKARDWIRMWLRCTADDLGDLGFDVSYGYGRINARKTVEMTPPAHELIAYGWMPPPYVEPGVSATVNAMVLNFGGSNETNVTVQLLANDTVVDSALIGFLAGGNSETVNLSWDPTIEGLYNVTLYVVPVPGETTLENNVVWKYIYVGIPVKAVVLHSAGNIIGGIISNWQTLNSEWHLFGDTMVYVDYTTLNKESITYEDIVATEADVLIISCACDPYAGWQFTDSEIEAITRYVHEGHGLIATAGTLYYAVPNNNKLAPLFGLNEATTWDATGTNLLHLLNTTHPIFTNVPNPLEFPGVGTPIPYDGRWDTNELVGGEYLALGDYQESVIVAFRGVLFISPWLEVLPPYYYYHLQLLYNAIIWSRYQKPEHELVVSLEAPRYLQPGESALLNATVYNMGLNNETDVELQMLINSEIVNSITIPELLVDSSYTIDYFWAPSIEKIYNITAYSPPLPGEESTLNNVDSALVSVRFVRFVLWDDTKDTDGDSLTGNYLNLYQLLTANGFVVDELTVGPIDSEILANYDILVLMDPELDFSPSEIADIQSWVTAGGGLITIPDGGYPSTLNTLMAPYGVQMTGRTGDYGTTTNIVSNPLTQGVGSIFVNGVREISTTSPSMTLAWTADLYAFLSATESGETVVVSDSNIMDNAGLGMADNTQLMLNMFSWVGVKLEHDVAVSLDVPIFAEPNTSVLLNALVRNRGLNNETNVEFELRINDTIVDSEVISELFTGESYMLSFAWIPTLEGVYNITAYALPVENESFIENNKATKFVKVMHPLIHPLEGQYANYMMYNIDPYTGEQVFRGLWNFTYLSYISSYQINITTWMKDIYNNTGTGWMIVNIFTRMVERDSGIYWAGMWYPGWIETNIGIGSTINLLWGNVTVVDSRVILACGFPMDCWELQIEQYGYMYKFWYDKASGLWIAMKAESPYGDSYLILMETNVPIGFMYEHDLAIMLDAPTRLSLGRSTILNATVYNTGLSNEANVILQLAINGNVVASEVIPELASGDYYILSYSWTPLVEGLYNVTGYAQPVVDEEYIENNARAKMVNVRLVTVALISDNYELLGITYIPDSMGVNYDIYNNNAVYFYTADLALLLNYKIVIFNNHNRMITIGEHTALQSYLSAGGNLIVTGYDSLGSPDDPLLADIVCSSSVGDNTGEPDLIVVDATHQIMNGPYGSFPSGYHIVGLSSDCDAAEADTARNAVTVAELADGYDKIIATKIPLGGKVVFWNGQGADDWTWNTDCQAMFKNMIDWMMYARRYTLTVYSVPNGVTFTVDDVSHTTPWSETYNENTPVTLEMPETHTVGDAQYYWNQWSDGDTSRSRTVTMTTNIALTAYFTGPYYQLTVTSHPKTGIKFTINGIPKTTPYTEWLLEGSYTLEMPEAYNGYVWSHWFEDGDNNRIKTIALSGTTWTAVYVRPPPVGGKTTPINTPTNEPEAPALWVWLLTLILPLVATAAFVKIKKKKQ